MTKKKDPKDLKKMGAPIRHTIPESEIPNLEKFGAMGARLGDIANYYNMSQRTLDNVFNRNPNLFQAIKKGKFMANIAVADSLYNNAVRENNVAAQIFWLKTRARWKEPQHFELRILKELFGKTDIEDATLVECEEILELTEKSEDE